jgi:hypothetical protein
VSQASDVWYCSMQHATWGLGVVLSVVGALNHTLPQLVPVDAVDWRT